MVSFPVFGCQTFLFGDLASFLPWKSKPAKGTLPEGAKRRVSAGGLGLATQIVAAARTAALGVYCGDRHSGGGRANAGLHEASLG